VLIGWLFFRAQSWPVAIDYLSRLVSWSHDGTRVVSPYILPAVGVVGFIHLIMRRDGNWIQELPDRLIVQRIAIYAAMGLLVICVSATNTAPFIYFRF